MSSYVNLLQDSEIQLRSMARDRKSLRVAISAACILVALGILLFFRHYLTLTGQANQLQARWKTLEPQYAKAKEREDILRSANSRLSELRGWAKTRYSIPELMEQLGALIPPNMQIISMELQGFLAGVEGEARMTAPGSAPVPPLPAPQRRYGLLLRGLFTGTDSEQKVLNFVESLKVAPFGDQLLNVKLLETAKTGLDNKELSGTRFSVDLQFKPRSLEWTKSN
jgi:hypothetical protein